MGRFFTGVVLVLFVDLIGLIIEGVNSNNLKHETGSCASKGGVLVVDTSRGSTVKTWCIKKEALLQ